MIKTHKLPVEENENFILSAFQRWGNLIKEYPMFSPAEVPKFFVLSSTELVQLGEQCNTQLNIVVQTNKLESH